MMRLIRRGTFILVLVLCHASLFCFGQNSKQSKTLDYFVKKTDALSYLLFKGQGSPPKELLNLLQGQARWDEATPGPTNPLGLRLRFVKIDEPAKDGGPAAVRYRVFADGAPENKVFSFGEWRESKDYVHDPTFISANAGASGSHDVYVNARGLLMFHRPKPEEVRISKVADEVEVTPTAVSAEPIRYVLDSLDEQLQIVGTLILHPVESEDQGCRIEVRIAQLDATGILLVIDGFEANARIPLVLQSGGEVANEVLTTDALGHAVTAGFPRISGKTQGTLKATAEGGTCLPAVELPWGAPSEPVPAPAPAAPPAPAAAETKTP